VTAEDSHPETHAFDEPAIDHDSFVVYEEPAIADDGPNENDPSAVFVFEEPATADLQLQSLLGMNKLYYPNSVRL
jgi:hypothetical protein